MSEKLQKVLARAGLGSRRQIDRWIEEGRITIDGQPATMGARVTPHQALRVDGGMGPAHAVQPDSVRDYIILHELAHTGEHNHSQRFWRLVERLCPQFQEAECWIKQHHRQFLR